MKNLALRVLAVSWLHILLKKIEVRTDDLSSVYCGTAVSRRVNTMHVFGMGEPPASSWQG